MRLHKLIKQYSHGHGHSSFAVATKRLVHFASLKGIVYQSTPVAPHSYRTYCQGCLKEKKKTEYKSFLTQQW